MQKKNHRSAYTPIVCALFICILYFLFNFLFVQRFLDWDQVYYTHNMNYALSPGGRVVFLSHHLYYQWGGMMFHRWVKDNFARYGYTDMPFNQRIRGLLAGCIGIFFAILFIKNMTGTLLWGIIGGILIGVCNGYLHYLTKIDTPIFPASGMLGTLWLFQKMDHIKKGFIPLSILMGIVLFIDVMFHQYMTIICFTCLLSLFLPPFSFQPPFSHGPFSILHPEVNQIRQKPKLRLIGGCIIIFLGGSLTLGAYFYAAETVYNLPVSTMDQKAGKPPFQQATLQEWLFLYARFNRWGKGYSEFDFRHPMRGFTDAFISQLAHKNRRAYHLKFLYDIDKPVKKESVIHNQVALFTFFAIMSTLFFFPSLLRRYGRTFMFIVLSFLFLSLFVTYWEAKYLEFWLIPCQLLCIGAILSLNLIAEKLKKFIGSVSHTLLSFVTLIFIISLALYNLTNFVIPFTREQRLEYMDSRWEEDHYMKLFSRDIYKNPDNPYYLIYKQSTKNSVENSGNTGYSEDDGNTGYVQDDGYTGYIQDDANTGYVQDDGYTGHVQDDENTGYVQDDGYTVYIQDDANTGYVQDDGYTGYVQDDEENE